MRKAEIKAKLRILLSVLRNPDFEDKLYYAQIEIRRILEDWDK